MYNSSLKSASFLAKSTHHLHGIGSMHLLKTLSLYSGGKFLFLLVSFLFLLTGCENEKVEPAPRAGTVTANAGPDQTVQVGQTVTLDASASKDDQNKTLSFNWAGTKKPAGSNVTLTNPTQAKPTFIPDLPGEYEWEVTVSSANAQKKDKVAVMAIADNTAPSNGILSEDITEFTVLENREADPAKPDYIVTNNIQVKARVAIAPGVVIEFEADKGLEVLPQGYITARGTATQKIVFTGKTKTPGFWKGILFDSNNALNELTQVEVGYAGSSTMRDMPENVKTNVGITGTAITAASLSVKNSSFTNANGYGMYVLGEIPVFSDNSFSDNSSLPLFVTANQIHKLDAASTFTGAAGSNMIGIGGTVHQQTTGVTWPLMQDGTKYVAIHDLAIEGGVTVAPGVSIEFMSNKGLSVNWTGYLKAKGTAANKITFTGLDKMKGFWKGIIIQSNNSMNEMDHVEVSYGGKGDYATGNQAFKANVVLWGDFSMIGQEGTLKVSNSSFTHSGGYGMAVQSAGGTLAAFGNNSFSHNLGAAMYVDASQVHKLDAASRLNDSNGYNGLETAGYVVYDQEVAWPVFNDGARYHITDDLYIQSGVKIQNDGTANAMLEFAADKALYVQDDGYMIAKGNSETALVLFSGKNYISGSWKGILIDSNSPLNQFDYVGMNYGGSNKLNGIHQKSNLGVRGRISVTNSEFRNSGGYGIFVTQGATINADAATVNEFQGNLQGNYHQE
ncbi:PKD domain-containing protein [Pontibacter pamirensis]|uniref:PKD domain-containing protein n=1 Tax=Pontibacter pamirensis TaxID=2562824 RepID=UPI001389679F|nr:hypothetical protein [Pontibacter pamirensis]